MLSFSCFSDATNNDCSIKKCPPEQDVDIKASSNNAEESEKRHREDSLSDVDQDFVLRPPREENEVVVNGPRHRRMPQNGPKLLLRRPENVKFREEARWQTTDKPVR